ncbi:BamA/TamA family outer membrane protein [candidate division KSB1 bacterium]|nr:BamA/TamA family outer membrane protein [candidate division KSB1 bacterium]
MKILIWIFITIIFTICFFNVYAHASKSDTVETTTEKRFKVVEIHFPEGIKTKKFIFEREMRIKKGDYVSAEMIEIDRKRIQNLGLFNRVEILTERTEEGVTLYIDVTERWYLIPYPILTRNDKDWNKLSYGLGVYQLNFRGRNETLGFVFYFGYNKKAGFSYSIPWLFQRWNLSSAFELSASEYQSQNLNILKYKERRQGIGYLIGKRFGYFAFLNFALGYSQLSTDLPEARLTLSPSGKDKWMIYQANFKYDNRDLKEFPHRGVYFNSYWRKSGEKGNMINYSRYGVDIRTYLPLPYHITFAIRSAVDLTRGQVPLYDHSYLGYAERIRGHFFEEYEAHNRFVGNLAFRFPIRKITYHSFFQDTPFADYYRNFPFGISGGLFWDFGTVWFQNEKLSAKKLLSGVGVGIFFHLPYVDIARVEYAFNENIHGEAILFDLGVAF